MINYEEVFALFVSDDEMLPNLMHPFKQGGLYFATDGHSLICLPEGVAELPYKDQDKPKCLSLIEPYNCCVPIVLAELESQLIPDMIEEVLSEYCDECDGDGTVVFIYTSKKGREYHSEDDCPLCDGNGEFTKKTGKKIPNPDKSFLLLEKCFTYKQLARLVAACKLMELATITKVADLTNNGVIFQCGEAKILLMPLGRLASFTAEIKISQKP